MTTTDYKNRHDSAMVMPNYGPEMGIVKLIEGLREWTRGYESLNGGKAFDDGVADAPVLAIAKAVTDLLNFDNGRLDGGLVWKHLQATLKEAGYEDGLDTEL